MLLPTLASAQGPIFTEWAEGPTSLLLRLDASEAVVVGAFESTGATTILRMALFDLAWTRLAFTGFLLDGNRDAIVVEHGELRYERVLSEPENDTYDPFSWELDVAPEKCEAGCYLLLWTAGSAVWSEFSIHTQDTAATATVLDRELEAWLIGADDLESFVFAEAHLGAFRYGAHLDGTYSFNASGRFVADVGLISANPMAVSELSLDTPEGSYTCPCFGVGGPGEYTIHAQKVGRDDFPFYASGVDLGAKWWP